MTSITLGGVTLTNVTSMSENKTANIIPLPIPTQDSDTTQLFDMLGNVEIISIDGSFTGESADVRTSVTSLKALVSGNQTATISLIDHTTTTFTVMVADVTCNWDLPGNVCFYSIKLFRGTTT